MARTYAVIVTGTGVSTGGYVTIGDAKYTTASTAYAVEGSTITCYGRNGVTVNGASVSTTYELTIVADTLITLNRYTIDVTYRVPGTNPNEYAVVISGNGFNYAGTHTVNIGGTEYESESIVYAQSGTTITCSNSTQGGVIVNGTLMSTSYSFSLTSDVRIICGSNGAASNVDMAVMYGSALSVPSAGEHTANISDVVYGISGATILCDDVLYDIESGRVLIDDVAMDIGFGQSSCTVSITGTGNTNNCYVNINGTKYYGAATVNVESGTFVTIYTLWRNSASAAGTMSGQVFLNDVCVLFKSTNGKNFSYGVGRNITIKLSYSAPGAIQSYAYITEE